MRQELLVIVWRDAIFWSFFNYNEKKKKQLKWEIILIPISVKPFNILILPMVAISHKRTPKDHLRNKAWSKQIIVEMVKHWTYNAKCSDGRKRETHLISDSFYSSLLFRILTSKILEFFLYVERSIVFAHAKISEGYLQHQTWRFSTK